MSTEEILDKFNDITSLPEFKLIDEQISTNIPNELCQILYTKEYKQLMFILNIVMKNFEYSNRTLELTSFLINLVPAFYTIWNFRFNILKKLSNDKGNDISNYLNNELNWLDSIILNNPKNYQIWPYRQSILSILHPSPILKNELPIIDIMLKDDDSKNYHIWSYRKWCILFFNNFQFELTFLNELIDMDIYNNSAWSHRFFTIKNLINSMNSDDSLSIFNSEILYIKQKIEYCPQNISTWNYLTGLLNLFNKNGKADDDLINFSKQFVSIDFDNTPNDNTFPDSIDSTYALEFLANQFKLNPNTIDQSKLCYKALSVKYDTIRSKYWLNLYNKL